MRGLTDLGEQTVAELAARYRVSADAVRTLLDAVRAGNGTMAQFSHPELGGRGQWMAGGMTMVGDMFNPGLQATVSALATELAGLLVSAPLFVPHPAATAPAAPAAPTTGNWPDPGTWWPANLGRPGASGGQNETRYAVFPTTRRLAVQTSHGDLRVYDTLDHIIGGVQQQQDAAPGTLAFTSQHGTFTVASLPQVGTAAANPTAPAPAPAPAESTGQPGSGPAGAVPAGTGAGGKDPASVLAAIDRLGDLHRRGVLSDAEFAAGKADLLSRLSAD